MYGIDKVQPEAITRLFFLFAPLVHASYGFSLPGFVLFLVYHCCSVIIFFVSQTFRSLVFVIFILLATRHVAESTKKLGEGLCKI